MGEQRAHGADHDGTNGEVENGAQFGFTNFAQCRNLHVGECSPHSRQQANDAGKQLVMVNGGLQRHHHAGKTH